MAEDKIRSLNYIFTYGPGSICELPNNKTVMILGTDFWEDPQKRADLYKKIFDERITSKFEIKNLFEPPEPQPDNTRNEKKESAYIPAAVFPDWHVCKKCNSLFRYSEFKNEIEDYKKVVYSELSEFKKSGKKIYKDIPFMFCPFCAKKSNIKNISVEEFRNLKFFEVYSFSWVVICSNGHIDNPDIFKLFNINKNDEVKLSFSSNGIESKEQEIWAEITGEKNKRKKTISDLYSMYSDNNKKINCTGKKYWLENNRKKCDCNNKNKNLRLVKKGDSQVYFPKIISSLSIPPFNNTEEVRHSDNIKEAVELCKNNNDNNNNNEYVAAKIEGTSPGKSESEIAFFIRKASRFIKDRYCKEVDDLSIIENYVQDDFLNDEAKSPDKQHDDENENQEVKDFDEKLFRQQEYAKLIETIHDEKLQPRFDSTAIKEPTSLSFLKTLTKVEDLIITHVVTSFSRVYPPHEEDKIKLQPIASKRQTWLPAIQVRGEGIFFDFKEEYLLKWEEKNKIFLKNRNAKYRDRFASLFKFKFLFDFDENNIHYFYLLHSFSHYLINILSFFSGFNAASLRERIYFQNPYYLDNDNLSQSVYGILISTSSGGTEASLGGLARYGDEKLISDLLLKTRDKLKVCSNDPICADNKPRGESHNFSTCFSCLYLPETSCEMRNDFLDRQLLIGEGNGIECPYGFLNML